MTGYRVRKDQEKRGGGYEVSISYELDQCSKSLGWTPWDIVRRMNCEGFAYQFKVKGPS